MTVVDALEFEYTLAGNPVPLDRARMAGDRMRSTSRVVAAKEAHQWAAIRALGVKRAEWPKVAKAYQLEVVAYRRENRGDADNFGKLVCDALEGVAYKNDNRVSDVIYRARVDKANPRTEVRVKVIE